MSISGFSQRRYYFKKMTEIKIEKFDKVVFQIDCSNHSRHKNTSKQFADSLASGFNRIGISAETRCKEESINDPGALIFRITRRKTQYTAIRRFPIPFLDANPNCYIFEIEQQNKVNSNGYLIWTRVKVTEKKFEKGLNPLNEKLALGIHNNLDIAP